MATTKPRITVTLSPQVYQMLRVISSAGGQTMSAIVSDLLDVHSPVLERMAVTMQRMKQLNDEKKAQVHKALDEAEATFAPVLSTALGQFDLFMGKLDAVAGGPPSARSDEPEPRAASRTPRTNRGVTPPPSKPRKPSSSKASKAIASKKVFSKT